MKNIYRGLISIILTALFLLLIVGGGALRFVPNFAMQENYNKTSAQNPPTQNKTEPTATIDQNSLNASIPNPTITGTFSNTSFIEVIVTSGVLPPDGLMSAAVSQPIWEDQSEPGGGVVRNGNTAGTFSDTIASDLKNGTYHIGIYNETIPLPQTDANSAKDSRHLLVSGLLTVTNSVSH